METSSAPRRKRTFTGCPVSRVVSPTVTRSRDTGMVPTSYWESTRRNRPENSSSSMGVSPRRAAHCSRPLHRISHSCRYSSARAGCSRRCSSAVKADRLPHPGPVLIFPQKLQRLRHLAAGPVQPLQQRPVLIGDGGPVPLGGHGPGLFLGPLAPPEVPFQHIVLQQVPVLLRQIGEAGLEIAEHIVIAVAVGHRVQRRRHQGEDGLVQDVRHGGGEHRDLIAGEDGLDQRLIDRQVPGRHPDVPAAQALGPQQAADPSGRLLHL